MKLTNKRILQIFSHCINENRTRLTCYNYRTELLDKINAIPDLEVRFVCSCGISKVVFLPIGDYNFVIKIPFTGTQDKDGSFYKSFLYDGEGISWYEGNYCDIEAERCKQIVHDGWGKHIAKTALIGIVGDLYIYKQELVNTIAEDVYYDDDDVDITTASKYSKKYGVVNEYWLAKLIDFIGEDEAINFMNYLQYRGWDNDLHGANVGFMTDGTPVIFDYSDFED